MIYKYTSIAGFCILFLAISSHSTIAQEAIMFRGGPTKSGVYDGPAVEGPVKILWSFEAEDGIISSPSISGGIVYVGSVDGNLYAINASNGSKLWSYDIDDRIFSSPAISEGIVYVGGWYNGNFYALDALIGEKLWSFATDGNIFSSPAISEGIVYIGSYDKNLYALDALSGAKLWSFATDDEISSSPAISEGIVYIGSHDRNLYALDSSSGAKLWSFATDDEISSSPAISEGIVYIGSHDGNFYALDALSGEKLWSIANDSIIKSSPAISESIVYMVSAYGNLIALNTLRGEKLWSFATNDFIGSSPAISEGMVYVGSDDGILYAFTFNENMVYIEGGTFLMGSTDGEDDENPVHSVTLDDFWIGKYEVTQAEWELEMASNPSRFLNDTNPVEKVSWYDAVAYCNALSIRKGLIPCYSGSGENIRCNFNVNGYRLPTEAEWEYAAKGGKLSQGYNYSGSNNLELVAWFDDNSGNKAHPVGGKNPNELGLYDMSGNVWEWCWDWFDDYSSMNQQNPTGPSSGSGRVSRGGSFICYTWLTRLTIRSGSFPSSIAYCGFRLVRNLEVKDTSLLTLK